METGTSISVEKGQKVDLTKTNPGVSAFKVGLGWNPNTAVGGEFDLDVSAFMLGEDGKRLSDNHIIFYNNVDGAGTKSRDAQGKTLADAAFGILHTGDNLTGEGEGDDESLLIDISKFPAAAKQVVFVVTIHEAAARSQNFGQVGGSFIRVCDNASGNEIMKYDLNEDYSVETAMAFGKLYEKDGEWKFEAVGTGMKGGLQDYLNQF